MPNSLEDEKKIAEFQEMSKKDKYVTDFAFNYEAYVKAHNMTDVNKEWIDVQARSVAEAYNIKVDPSEVMRFFGIPEKWKGNIEQRRYSVKEEIKAHDPNRYSVLITLTLTMNDMIYIPGVTDQFK